MPNTIYSPSFTLNAPIVEGTNVTINYTIIDAREIDELTTTRMRFYSDLISAKIYYRVEPWRSFQTNPYSIIEIPVNQPDYAYTTTGNNSKSFDFFIQNFSKFTDYQYYIEFQYQISYDPPTVVTTTTSKTYESANNNIFKTGNQSPAITVPVLVTKQPGSITQTSAISGGDITSDGNAPIFEKGILYGKDPEPSTNKIKSNQAGSAPYDLNITNLSPNTDYYVRAYAVNKIGIGYGSSILLKTLPVPPNIPSSISTGTVGQITAVSAICQVTITSIGSSAVTSHGIIWATSASNLNPNFSSYTGILTNNTQIPTSTQVPSVRGPYEITGLVQNTTYYVRAWSNSAAGTAYGETKSFKTFGQLAAGEYRLPTDGVSWYQLYDNWEIITTSNTNSKAPFLRVKDTARKDIVHPISYYFNATFSSNRNYQFRTIVEEFYDTHRDGYVGKSNGASFSMITPWGERFSYPAPYFHTSDSLPDLSPVNLYFYGNLPDRATTYFFQSKTAKKESEITAQNPITYSANHLFGTSNSPASDPQNEGIGEVRLNELSWKIQGFSFFTFNLNTEQEAFINGTLFGGKGWHYRQISKYDNVFTWFDRHSSTQPVSVRPHYEATNTVQVSENDKNNPVGGEYDNKNSHSGYRTNNYIAKYIPYQNFNLSFSYLSERQDIGIKIYLSPTLPNSKADNAATDIIPKEATLILAMTQSKSESNGQILYGVEQKCDFVGLEGNQYIYIVGDRVPESTSSTYSICKVIRPTISGGYHSGNNKKYIVTDTGSYPIFTSATFSTLIGSGNTVNAADSATITKIAAKIGNGVFNSGIWENGVWNSGWREDSGMREFYKVERFFSMNRDKKWRVSISGPASSLSTFSTGDKVAISNIVAIDLNEGRNLLKRHFSIVEKNETEITVEFESEFPLRRIEIDSSEHRILMTKNIWLSGTFFNGYFKGIWNYGLFAGYPFLTKMEDSHWIDGIFTGGHFYADKYKIAYSQTVKSEYSNSKRLGLTFSSPHRLIVGDIITVLGDPNFGETVIVSVPDQYSFITGIAWKREYEFATGIVFTIISSGLIQNFDLRSNNVSKVTSMQSLNSPMVFSYNSWIDVNYSNKSAVNIGRPQFSLDEVSGKNYAENNLYGYVTTDVLSSKSSFRDSFSNTVRNYKLGIKYKIFSDYVGDSSKFDEYFDSTDTESGLESFKNQGWSFYKNAGSYLTFSRTKEPLDASNTSIGKELYVYAKGKGGVLNLSTAYDIPNRTNGEVDRSRYTLVEFDLVSKSVSGDSIYVDESNGMSQQVPIHFGNLNYVTRNGKDGLPKKVPATYLPIYENTNHLTTGDLKKQEFFFNKRNLMMNFRGTGNLGDSAAEYYIDGLKLYEVDMVPFFQYFKNDNINKSVQNPYQAIAPVIDYTDTDLNDAQILSRYIDNISDIPYENGINWIEDIILNRYQMTANEFDTDTEDITIEQGSGAAPPQPSVQTKRIFDVTSMSAKLEGLVTSGGPTTERGVAFGVIANPTVDGNIKDAGTGEGAFTVEMELYPGQQYYARAYAKNETDIAYGAEISFKTTAFPTVATNAPSEINNTSVTLSGVISENTVSIAQFGIAWSTEADQNKANKVQSSQGALIVGEFSVTISSLTKNTAYNAWAYAISSGHTIYGQMVSFTTENVQLPQLSTTSPTTVSNGFQSGGTLTSNGGSSITECGIMYGTNDNPTTKITNATAVNSGAFSSYAPSLTPGTTYYVKAYATNKLGTGYGSIATYLHPAVVPSIETGNLGQPSSTQITIYSNNISTNGGSTIQECGIVYSTSANPTTTASSKTPLATPIQSGAFEIKLTSLQFKTKYYARAYAINSVGTSYGTQIEFETIADLPIVQTGAIYDIKITSAGNSVALTSTRTGNVNYAKVPIIITDTGGSPILEMGILWSASAVFPTESDLKYSNSTYDILSVAPNNSGYDYVTQGTNTKSLPTPNTKLTLPNRIFIEGQTSAIPTSANSNILITSISSPGNYVGTMTGLITLTSYSVRAYARNSIGTAYGPVVKYDATSVLSNDLSGGGNTNTPGPSNDGGGGGGGASDTPPPGND